MPRLATPAPSTSLSYLPPRATLEVCCVLWCPPVAHAPWLLCSSYLPQPLTLRALVRPHIHQPFDRLRGPSHMWWCFGVHRICLFNARRRRDITFVRPPQAPSHFYLYLSPFVRPPITLYPLMPFYPYQCLRPCLHLPLQTFLDP